MNFAPPWFQLPALEATLLDRQTSFFADDLQQYQQQLHEAINGKSFLFIGAAGSIGSQTLLTISRFGPKKIHVIDANENGLAELVRYLRSRREGFAINDFLTLPLNYASPTFTLWLEQNLDAYDAVFNFAALKHVRTEKDAYSILAMLETNFLSLVRLYEQLSRSTRVNTLFSVSTDKAANPSSMMGATKRMMEHAMFSSAFDRPKGAKTTSARFANVAFSNGSLLQSWQTRMAMNQPLVAPRGCQRYFVSLGESGHLCALAGLLGDDQHIVVPQLDPTEHLVYLEDQLRQFLSFQGYEALIMHDENEAKSVVESLAKEKKWPIFLTPLDTAGEKPYEEFVGKDETCVSGKFSTLEQVSYLPGDQPSLTNFVAWLDELRAQAGDPKAVALTVQAAKDKIATVEKAFMSSHVSSKVLLDNRM